MAASVDVTGLAQFSKSVRRAVTGDLQKQMVKSIQDAAPGLVREMHGAAHTRIQKHAVGSVTARKSSAGIDLAGGQGGGLDAVLFPGGEYGGRKSKKRTYATRSPLGRPYVVNRRTTMQFLPHLGRHGYFFWPTVRDGLKALSKRQEELLSKALG